MPRSICTLSLALAVLGAACGPAELPTPSTSAAERLITAQFADANVTVREVSRSEGTLRVPAEFNSADVIFVLIPGGSGWEIAHVEQGGNSYTVEQLHEIAATMQLMSDLSDGLESYLADEGSYPMLDDQVGLRQLVPGYYQHPEGELLIDVWGTPLRYRVQGVDYTMTSTGPDGQLGSSDDIILITGTFVSVQ